jgi:hypothetical protein
MKPLLLKILMLMMLLAVEQLFSGPATLAQDTSAQIYLQPVSVDGPVVTVEVMAENVTDLYGAEFTLVYNPAEVMVVDANPQQEGVQITGGQLLPPQQGFVVVNKADPALGIVTFAMTLLNPAPAVSGSGALAQIAFTRQTNAPTTIDFTNATLVAINMQTIPVQLSSLTIDQDTVAASAGPTSTGGFPWWLVAAGIIVLGIVALGVLMYLGTFKPGSPSQPGRAPQKTPSAFK